MILAHVEVVKNIKSVVGVSDEQMGKIVTFLWLLHLYPKLILNSLGYSEGSIGYKIKEVN